MANSSSKARKLDSTTGRGLGLPEEKATPVLEKLSDSGRKLKRVAGGLLEQLKPNGRPRSVSLFIAGTGSVGGTLIDLIARLKRDHSLRLVGACNTSHYVWAENGIDPAELAGRLEQGSKTDWNNLLNLFSDRSEYPIIFVDATGSEEVARLYPALMKKQIHIATPSKRANTFEQSFYDELQELAESENINFLYETTVGAGLPVISTITDLMKTGDTVTEISGVVSGTMTYIFNELEIGTSFSNAVIQALESSYSEPDPRDDLSGEDVARKFLTLARTIGLKVERSELDVETLVPQKLISVDRDTFLSELSEVDVDWRSKMERARENNKTLRYIGKLTHQGISVGIRSVPTDSPLGQLRGTDNLFQISSNRYSDTPIVIQGPGAGREVTAAGVLVDVLKIARSILAPEH